MNRQFIGLLACIVTIALMLAALPSPVVVAESRGSTPEEAIDITGTMSYTLDSGSYCWFRFWMPGDGEPRALTFNWSPATKENAGYVHFTVWTPRNDVTGKVVLDRIGGGTPPEGVLGVKYWRGSLEEPRNLFVQVVNTTREPVDYALALTGDTYPPPALAISPDASQPSPGGSGIPVEPLPMPTPTPIGETTGGGTSPQTATPVDALGSASGRLATESSAWVSFYNRGNGKPSAATLAFSPVTEKNIDDVTFKVWAYVKTPQGLALREVGRGTRSGNPFGPKYWRGGTDSSGTYYLEIVNYNKDIPVEWSVKIDYPQT